MTKRQHTDAASPDAGRSCPGCGGGGSRVGRVTLEALLKPAAAGRLTDERFRFCDSLGCEVVYFGDLGTVFSKDDLAVRVGVKEQSAPRPVCYCFDHTIEEINNEVAETGRCTVLDDIRTRMKDGCRCETKNPKGSCCLGTVERYVRIALAEHGGGDDGGDRNDPPGETPGCCPGGDGGPSCCAGGHRSNDGGHEADAARQRAGFLAAGGSMLAALAASACCWLPLGLMALGVSAGGASAWFERYRGLSLGISAVLLGTGFYLVHFRTPRCGRGSACADPRPGFRRLNHAMLWAATVVVIASALFPRSIGLLLGGRTPAAVSAEGQARTARVRIEGMTCEACAATLRYRLAGIPGVLDAEVSYRDGSARLSYAPGHPPPAGEIEAAVSGAGYRAGAVEFDGD